MPGTRILSELMTGWHLVSWQEQFLGLWWAVKGGAGLEVVLGGTPWRKLHKTLSVCDPRIEMADGGTALSAARSEGSGVSP